MFVNFLKNLLFILITIPLIFSSCKKCKECENDSYHYIYNESNYYDEFGNPIMNFDSIKTPHWEVCRDDFDSKDEYQDYIEFIEEEQGYDCKSDFWN